YFVSCKYNLIRFIKVVALAKYNIRLIYVFLIKYIILRYRYLSEVVVDNKVENKSKVKKLLKDFSIKRVTIFVYNSLANSIIEIKY
ncbi:hypothetical protein CONLIGDRAFT_569866, partial [Coniochaeta ligniaria NRRL 30616]